MSGGPDACWLWTGYIDKDGYGRFKNTGTTWLAWEYTNGSRNGLHVLHNCPGRDNPACCNPKHLWLGTHQDNMADMAAKGTRKGIGRPKETHTNTHCKNGHLLDEANTHWYDGGRKKSCRRCHAEYVAGRRVAKRVAAGQPPEPPLHYQTLKTHCKHGHPFDEANTYWYRGMRQCKACSNGRVRHRNKKPATD